MKYIKIDYDNKNTQDNLARADKVFQLLKLKGKFSTVETVKGSHVTIKVDADLSNREIVLIQVLCGSDWKRELLNYKRLREGNIVNWNVLFNEKRDLLTDKKLSEEKKVKK